eukprot:1161818-Pelagomonas_calceolata.AAC.4
MSRATAAARVSGLASACEACVGTGRALAHAAAGVRDGLKLVGLNLLPDAKPAQEGQHSCSQGLRCG